jgi:hypothetical protein
VEGPAERGDRSCKNGEDARSPIIGLAVWCSVLAIVLFGLPLAVAVLLYAEKDVRSELARSARDISIEVSLAVYEEDRIQDVNRRAADAAVYDEVRDSLGGDPPDDDWPELDRAPDGDSAAGSHDGHYYMAVPVTHSDEIIGAVIA